MLFCLIGFEFPASHRHTLPRRYLGSTDERYTHTHMHTHITHHTSLFLICFLAHGWIPQSLLPLMCPYLHSQLNTSKSALSLVVFLISHLLPQAQLGKQPITTPPEISHGWWLSLPLKHSESSFFFLNLLACLRELGSPASSVQPLANGIFIDLSKNNWGTGTSSVHMQIPDQRSEPLPNRCVHIKHLYICMYIYVCLSVCMEATG